MNVGGLYLLAPMNEKYPHIQKLFPYMTGGKVLVVKTQKIKIKSKKKTIYIETIDFLFMGKLYSESACNFTEHIIY